MPRDGSLILSDVRRPTLATACATCGRYNVERLMAQHRDAKLTDLLATLADCQGALGHRPRQMQGRVRAALAVRILRLCPVRRPGIRPFADIPCGAEIKAF
jgi:hypothetical protein